MAKVGRNDSCPCGSGRKHKKCCGPKGQRTSRLILMAVAAAAIAAVITMVAQFTTDREGTGPRRAWSAEHGHYHDVP